jgi:hypothetical protein
MKLHVRLPAVAAATVAGLLALASGGASTAAFAAPINDPGLGAPSGNNHNHNHLHNHNQNINVIVIEIPILKAPDTP